MHLNCMYVRALLMEFNFNPFSPFETYFFLLSVRVHHVIWMDAWKFNIGNTTLIIYSPTIPTHAEVYVGLLNKIPSCAVCSHLLLFHLLPVFTSLILSCCLHFHSMLLNPFRSYPPSFIISNPPFFLLGPCYSDGQICMYWNRSKHVILPCFKYCKRLVLLMCAGCMYLYVHNWSPPVHFMQTWA